MPPVRMCIESETVGEIPGEKSPPFDYTVVESVFLLEDRLFIMVGGLCQQRRNVIPLGNPEKVDVKHAHLLSCGV